MILGSWVSAVCGNLTMTPRMLLLLATLATPSYGSEAMEQERNPVANPRAVVLAGQARFTVLTPEMIRMEWSANGMFEDRASLVFINRRLPVPEFTVDRTAGRLTITTGALTLRYTEDSRPFDADNLSIEKRGQEPSSAPSPVQSRRSGSARRFPESGRARPTQPKAGPHPLFRWHPGTEDKANLGGTYRTLDSVSGGVPLPPGLLSRNGWVLVDDSPQLLFDAGDWPWATPRPDRAALDWYFFGYGHNYKRALHDFVCVAGRVPLPPRFAFGAWWSRYWAYSDKELQELVAEFRTHDVPLDVLVIDMDWHLEGWTGYTWNPQYFPDPEGFLKWVHDQGLRVTLNLHPADGVKKHERAFPDVAQAMGLDPETADHVPFDCTDRRYMDAYFKYLHHPLERQGVDFWWIDWQQGQATKLESLDPLWWLNYLHWTDMERNPERAGRRPMMFSRWGGLGNHRYQIGFSGDTYCNWPSLAFQPYFTATAGNVCYPYWSHDIGGHQPGPVDPELYARWIQWGAFSPILRTHTTKNPAAERRIWKFPDEVFRAAREAYQLRYELIPYIYSAARQCYDTGLPLCRPLYYEWPELEEAYNYTAQYMFGDDLLLAPVVKPASPISGCAEVQVWLPPGEWTNWFSGRTYAGPAVIPLQVALDETPVFVRSGAIIPVQPKMLRTGERPVDPLMLHIWPGESGSTRVYEDDRETVGYQEGACAWTPVSHKLSGGARHIRIGPVEGEFKGMLKERQYEIHLRDVWPVEEVLVDGTPLPKTAVTAVSGWWYDEKTLSVVIRLAEHAVTQPVEVRVIPVAENVVSQGLALLRGGLRGQWDRLEEAATLVAMPPPDPLTDSAALRSLLASGQVQPDDLTRHLLRCGHRTLVGIMIRSDLAPPVSRRLLMRLLALQCQVDVAALDSEQPKLRVRGVASLSPPIGLLQSASGRWELTPPPHWSIQGPAVWSSTELLEDKPLVVVTTLTSEGPPQTTVLCSKFTLETDTLSLEIPGGQLLLPSINRWWVVGPFPAPFEEALDRVFPPEQAIDLAATYDGHEGEKIGWRKVERAITPSADLTEEFFVRLDAVFGRYRQQAVCYALTYLHAPEDTEATLALGTDDGAVLWLNGAEVYRHRLGRPYQSKEDRVPVRLEKGSNALLLKVSQSGGDWGFCVHVETPDGEPLTSVTAHLQP
ncbi:MAG: TIM-barrel domain-containing protein [Planctomycetota bacterium]